MKKEKCSASQKCTVAYQPDNEILQCAGGAAFVTMTFGMPLEVVMRRMQVCRMLLQIILEFRMHAA